MFGNRSKKKILAIWLKAAEEFAQSSNPNVGRFARISGHATFVVLKSGTVMALAYAVQEIAGARAEREPDKVDATLLRSGTAKSILVMACSDLFELSRQDGLLSSQQQCREGEQAVRHAIERRRGVLKIKARTYFVG